MFARPLAALQCVFYAIDSVPADWKFASMVPAADDLDRDCVRDFATTTDGTVARSLRV